MIRNIFKFIVILGLICVVSGGGVAAIYAVFKGHLARREKEARQSAIMAVCPPGATVDTSAPISGDPFSPEAVYAAKGADGQPVAYVAGGEETGYSSVVKIMVGAIKEDQALKIYKVAVLSQAETPGLGATIAEQRSTYTLWKKLFGAAEPEEVFTPFIRDFSGKTAEQVPDVHAITAATITSDAVKSAVDDALGRIHKAVLP